mmetsp:Transcript_14925/g.20858  ORF Transcript_14925/g.20858 Transcript_14925/m.20858 type:complete len:235 (-) Transcript_14925:38-742(-)
MSAPTKDDLLKQADELQLQRKIKEVFEILSAAVKDYPEDPQVLWRLARAHFDMADDKPQDANYRKEHFFQGLAPAEKALQLDNNHFAIHKWYAIMLSQIGDFIPSKEKIANAFKIKEHALKALELKPDDPTTLHMLGKWCVGVASVSWIERKIAATLFGTPPESSYEEALTYFLKASELEPKFLRNAICIGDCYYQLKQWDNAKQWYQKAVDIPTQTEGDKVLHNEAKTKLSKL